MVLEFSTPKSAGKQRRTAAASSGGGVAALGGGNSKSKNSSSSTLPSTSGGVGDVGSLGSPVLISPAGGSSLRREFDTPPLSLASVREEKPTAATARVVVEEDATTAASPASESKRGLFGGVRKTLSIVSGGWVGGERPRSVRVVEEGGETEAGLPSASGLEGLCGLQAAEKAIEMCMTLVNEHRERSRGLEDSVPGSDFGRKLASALEKPGAGEAPGQKMELVQRIRQVNDDIVQRGANGGA